MKSLFSVVVFLVTINESISSPILVKFGTNEGPIKLPPVTTTTASSKSYTALPAPVYETPEDVPNPTVYKPLVPHQYRSKIYSHQPNPNLILGTPLDRKFTPSLQKNIRYTKSPKSFGLYYQGPQTFGYESYEDKYQNLDVGEKRVDADPRDNDAAKIERPVPEIGVVYSSGVRYYVPQIVYYNNDDVDNSLHEATELKRYFNNRNKY